MTARKERERTEALRRVAETGGLTFEPKADLAEIRSLGDVQLFARGYGRRHVVFLGRVAPPVVAAVTVDSIGSCRLRDQVVSPYLTIGFRSRAKAGDLLGVTIGIDAFTRWLQMAHIASTARSWSKTMRETAGQYAKRILGYAAGKDPLTMQRATPRKLAALLKGKSRTELTHRPAGRWSIAQIVAHLADAEVATSWRWRQILSTNKVPIQSYDQDAWASTFDYAHRDPKQSLELFRVLRASNVALLASVPRSLWRNHGVHEERGNESITRLMLLVAGHDLNHLKQVAELLKRRPARR